MPPQPIAIKNVGLVTSVGLTAPASCAAIRAKISNPSETPFMGSDGEWIMGHQVQLEKPWRGLVKLARMAAMAIAECLGAVPRDKWPEIPLLLCVAEHERPGRLEGLDERLLLEIQQLLGTTFSVESDLVPHGRAGAVIALMRARKLIHEHDVPLVLIAATDALLHGPTIDRYESDDRLLTSQNSNGFVPGEAGGALLVGRSDTLVELLCAGFGFALERAHITSDEPPRAEGLTSAIKAALAETGSKLHEFDYRITDLSGEQYYFKELAIALGRILRRRKEGFEIWHPAECIGEVGAVAGIAIIAMAKIACQKGYSVGNNILIHMGNDHGDRVAAVLNFKG